MANFTRVKPAGWAANEILTAAQMNQLDIDHAKSINGDDGGSYAGALSLAGNLTLNGAALILTGGNGIIQYRVGTLGDADANINVSKDSYYFTAAPTVNRTYTVQHTGSAIQGNRIRVTMTLTSAAADAIFKRENATEIGRIKGLGNGGFIEFEFVTAKGWIVSAAGEDGQYTVPH